MNYTGKQIVIEYKDIATFYEEQARGVEYCPIVEAIRRALPKAKRVSLKRMSVWIDGFVYRLPSEAIGVINDLYYNDSKHKKTLTHQVVFELGEML